MDATVQHKQTETTGEFFIEIANVKKAEMTYNLLENHIMDIVHTEVSEELRGNDIGHKLIKEAVKYARENKKTIKPTCPFVESYFKKNKKSLEDITAHG